MKILIVTQYYPPHVGGLEVVAQKQAASLACSGHDVQIVTCRVTGAAPGDCRENGTTVIRIRAWNYLDRRFQIPFVIPRASWFAKINRAVKAADVVILHDVFYPICWIAFLLARMRHKPVVLVQHVALVDHPTVLVRLIQRLLYSTVGMIIFKLSERVAVFNQNVRSFVLAKDIPKQKVSEVRNGVDLEQFKPAEDKAERLALRAKLGLPLDKAIVLFVGRLVPKKGFDSLIAARDCAYEIVVVGGGKSTTGEANHQNVRFMGALPHASLCQIYRAADIFVLPSKGELFTVAMQEAMASGLPVVVRDDPGYAAYNINRNLIAFVDAVPSEIKHRILEVLGSENRRLAMSRYSQKLANEWFDWDTNFRAFESLLSNVARQQEHRSRYREALFPASKLVPAISRPGQTKTK